MFSSINWKYSIEKIRIKKKQTKKLPNKLLIFVSIGYRLSVDYLKIFEKSSKTYEIGEETISIG